MNESNDTPGTDAPPNDVPLIDALLVDIVSTGVPRLDSILQGGLASGFDAHVPKPVDALLLVRAIRDLVATPA